MEPRGLGGLHRRFEGILGRIQNPARLVGGEIGSGPGFSQADGELRVVLAFPDAYEVGISNQALQILYGVARAIAGVSVERTYLPWVDAIAEMRKEGVPLLTLETWTPVAEAHVLGVSLQHELNYTNVLELLDLAGIPLRNAERNERHPLVIAGGPAVADFLPMAPFLDAVVVGDGEEVFPQILDAARANLAGGGSRATCLETLAAIRGVFVPGLSARVTRRVLRRLEGAPYPEQCLVPLTEGVHDRAWVEVARGCTRGCRFCQAGMWYRPVRERSRAEVLRRARGQLAATGHQELSLGSLSVTDYSGLPGVLGALAVGNPEVRVALPSLRVDSAAVKLGHLTSPTSPSVTLAPEAGSQRMRDVVNKNVDEEDIFNAAREAFALGHTTLKLYFMMGLPTETDEDVEAIADLCLRLRRLGKETLGSRASRLKLNVSVTNFIPKAFTPFQWAAMADPETLRRRQGLLRQRLAVKGVKLSVHDISSSYVEAALARGGMEAAAVIEGAWRRGARFDSWTEHARPDAWAAAFSEAGSSAETLATTEISTESTLPWDIIDGVVSKGYLLAEWERARAGLLTTDCRTEACGDCGACVGGVEPDLWTSQQVSAAAERPAAASDPGAGVDRRYLLTFAARGRARFLAHLDTMELFRRAIRRAGGRLALSGGMRPKPLFTLALARAVGVEGRAELAEFALVGSAAPGFAERLQNALPEGFSVLGLEPYHPRRSVAARVVGARYRVIVTVSDTADAPTVFDASVLREAARLYTCAPVIMVDRRRPDGIRQVDVRAFVEQVSVVVEGDTAVIGFSATVSPVGTVRPEEIVAALSRLAGLPLAVESVERLSLELD
ncbi:MAG: TIGR03936 family radical SAM-associated protein [Thermoleophilia bacterium]